MATSTVSPDTSSVGSGADLMSSVPADLFSGADVSEFPDTPEGDGDEYLEASEPNGAELPAIEEPVVEEEPLSDDEPLPLEEAAKPADELPEGVKRGKDRNGKEGLWLTPNRYDEFHGAHRTMRDYAEVIGEAVTPESLDLRQRAFMGQERLYTNLNSGDPALQADVIGHFFNEFRRAHQTGQVASNPAVPFAQEFYKQVKSDPDAYASLRMEAANDLLKEMKDVAGESQNVNLWRSVAWVAKQLGMEYSPEVEMQNFVSRKSDPLHQANTRIQELQTQLNGRQAADSTAQYESWKANLAQTNAKAITDEALIPSISEEQRTAWAKFPAQFQNLVIAPLNKQVRDVIAKDAGFQERLTILGKQAERATSAQVRANIANEIQRLYVNRARVAAGALNGPLLKEAGALLHQQNQSVHQRRQTAKNQNSPQGSRTQVPRSLIPESVVNGNRAGTSFNVNDAVRDSMRLVGG